MRRMSWLVIICLVVVGLTSGTLLAQAPVAGPPADQEATTLAPEELDKLVGRIALYPDELIAIVLPASTYPLQIVQAARFLEKKGNTSVFSEGQKMIASAPFPYGISISDYLGNDTIIIQSTNVFGVVSHKSSDL